MIEPDETTTDIPLLVDDRKDYPNFQMTRLSYFCVECATPSPGWTLVLEQTRVPFLMMGLSGIITGPPERDRFSSPDDIDAIFARIEADERFYVDINDLWIPNSCFRDSEPQRGDVIRIGLKLFEQALAFRGNSISMEVYIGRAHDFADLIEPSPEEAEAFSQWNIRQIERAVELHHTEYEGRTLKWAEDERYPE